jgi:hypothetical protein
VPEPTLAIEGLLLAHDPPVVESDTVIVPDVHSADGAVIADGKEVTVASMIAAQPPAL